eukprot:952297_1
MATLLLFLFSCIVSSNAQVEDAGYIWIKNISDSRLSDYEGIYSKDDCGGDCGCNTGCCGAQYAVWVSPQHVYKKIHPSGDMYLYKEATGIDATFTPAGDMWVPLLITLKDGRTGNCPNWQNDEYVLKYPLHYDHLALWQNASGSDWSDTNGTSVTVDICTSEQPSCATSSPTNVPSSQPSSSPSENPSRSPSDQPTNQPTPAPTAPRVKYQFCKELTTFVQTDFKICLFISSDPMGDSVVRISMSGPNDRSWMVFFAETAPLAYGETASNANADQYLDFFNNKASGYVVNPTDTNAPAGEIFIDQTSGYTYMDYSTYDQNSNITLDVNYKSDQALATVERQLFTNDAEDWEFTFAHLLDQFYICFVAQQSGQINFGVTNDKDCTDELNPDGYTYNREQIEGNYGLRASWEFDPFAIYMEYNPFTGVYNGQCTKPKDAWILWGRYYANPVDATTGSMWNFATFCDTESALTVAGFASLLHLDPRVLSKLSVAAQVWRIGIDDLGDTHRINFTVNATDLDGGGATGWDTSHFFLTELLQFNVFYYLGSTTKMKTDFSAKNELFANGSAVLDYVTSAPTIAPTAAPTYTPTEAPSYRPTSTPSNAPNSTPSSAPSNAPSSTPRDAPSSTPSNQPSNTPSIVPTSAPSDAPSTVPSNSPGKAPTESLCDSNDVKRNVPTVVGDLIVAFEINCETEILLVNITYPTYDDKWFGLVFARKMLGDALVWTTGKNNDRELGLYAYNNVNKMGNGSGVEYTPDKNWRQRVVTRRRLELNIIYEQDLWLGFGDITADQDAIAFRWVTGDTLQLEYHNRSSNYDELYLENVATSTPQYDDLAETYEIVFIVFVSFFVIMGLSAWVDAKYMRMNDYLNITQLAGMAIQSLDMLSDCFFAINVSIGHTMDPKYSLALIFTIIFIVVPAFMTILQLHYQCKRWTHSSDKVRGWLSSNLKELYFLSMCTGSSFAAIMFVNSYVFQLEVCDMGLTDKELKEFSYKRVYSVVLFENIPQLVLQIWYLWSISTLDDAITITSIVLSVISILISVLSMLTERNIAQSQGYAAISIKLTGRAITSSSKNCKTLKRVLTEQLALLVGVDPSVVEVLKPTHIKQGFHLNVNFYFDDVNKPWIDYHQILLSASTTQQLQEVFRQSWQLPTKPDIHDIRVTIIESIIARNTAEPTTIVETKKLISDTYPIQCPQKVEIK